MIIEKQLWYLIEGLLNKSYDIKTFCSEFTRIYDLETDYSQLSKQENTEFRNLSEMTSRFSDYTEDLKIPNMFYGEKEILKKVRYIKAKLRKQ